MAAELTVIAGGKAKASTRRPRAKSLSQAIADGDALAELRALRVLLSRRLSDPKTSAVAVAALTKQFRELGEQIAAIECGGDKPSSTEGSTASDASPDEPWDDDV